MDFMSSAVLSGIVYDLLKNGMKVSSESLKNKFQDWLVDDQRLNAISNHLQNLHLSDQMSEKAIDKQISCSEELLVLLKSVIQKPQITINQTHSGSGDNVAGNKINNY